MQRGEINEKKAAHVDGRPAAACWRPHATAEHPAKPRRHAEPPSTEEENSSQTRRCRNEALLIQIHPVNIYLLASNQTH